MNRFLTLLGVGGAFDADKGIANTNGLLTVEQKDGSYRRILFDCGFTAGRQLDEMGLSAQDVDEVVITHLHADHVGGLENLGFKSKFLYDRKPRLITTPDLMLQLRQMLSPSMRNVYDGDRQPKEVSLEYYFDVTEIRANTLFHVADESLMLKMVPVIHIVDMESYGIEVYEIDASSPVVRWSGDTIYEPGSVLYHNPEDCKYIFQDCSFSPYYKNTVHAHFDELKFLPEDVREKVVLMHYGTSPETKDLKGMSLGIPHQEYKF